MIIVRKLLEEKDKEEIVYSVSANDTVLQALKVMAEANTGAVLVSERDQYVGIFTERDYARDVELQGFSAKDTRVKQVMTEEMVSVKARDKCAGMYDAHDQIPHSPSAGCFQDAHNWFGLHW